MGPFIKLFWQVWAGLVMVWFADVRVLEFLGEVPSFVLAVLWIVAITNAFNFLDNMDGLAGGVAVICAGIFLVAALLGGQWFIAAALGLLIGAVLGFLVFNFPPARIFMGDGGSLVVGFLLAFCSLRLTYVELAPGEVGAGAWWAVFTPVVVLAIPLYDLASVTVIRLAQGRSPFVGDTQHFSHRLVRRGLGRPAAVVVIWALSLATGIGGIMLGRVPGWAAGLVVAQTLAILLALALLERGSARGGGGS
jgi:UDP-GlcNAc:undecaprenyl-phosphate GlcNAc-1-phosphate transferase